VYWPAKAILDQFGQVADVVNVRMGKKHGVNLGRVNEVGYGLPVLEPVGLGALKQAAVHKQGAAMRFQQMAGAGYGARRAKEADSCHGVP
jgi:hypothetical protein